MVKLLAQGVKLGLCVVVVALKLRQLLQFVELFAADVVIFERACHNSLLEVVEVVVGEAKLRWLGYGGVGGYVFLLP